MNSRIFRGFSLATLALVLAACSSVPLDETRGTDTDARGAVDPTTGLVMDPFDPASPLARDRSVYFDFDSYVRSEEHTSELQSRGHLVCRLLLEKKKMAGIMPD